MKFTKLLCSSDFHGSDIVFRKFVNACITYQADAGFISGDLTGKAIVPVLNKGGGKYIGHLFGSDQIATTKDELEGLVKRISDVGFYPIVLEPDQAEELSKDKGKTDKLFQKVMMERLDSWMDLVLLHLTPKGIPLYIIPGNDDDYLIDTALSNIEGVFNPDGKVEIFNHYYEIIGMAESNMTPWACPRDVEEDRLKEKLSGLVEQLANPGRSIWLFHDPPYNSMLDVCPMLDADLKIVTEGGQVLVKSAGSTSIRKAVEDYQPLLTIHGHIHESAGCRKIGKTTCINPGSEYAEGILRTVMVNVVEDKVRGHIPISV